MPSAQRKWKIDTSVNNMTMGKSLENLSVISGCSVEVLQNSFQLGQQLPLEMDLHLKDSEFDLISSINTIADANYREFTFSKRAEQFSLFIAIKKTLQAFSEKDCLIFVKTQKAASAVIIPIEMEIISQLPFVAFQMITDRPYPGTSGRAGPKKGMRDSWEVQTFLLDDKGDSLLIKAAGSVSTVYFVVPAAEAISELLPVAENNQEHQSPEM